MGSLLKVDEKPLFLFFHRFRYLQRTTRLADVEGKEYFEVIKIVITKGDLHVISG